MPLILLAVALGGAAGTVLRALTDLLIPGGDLPWSTVAVNLVGSLVLGLLAGGLNRRFPTWLREGAQTGLLGGFTTYSALALWAATSELANWLSLLFAAGVAVAGVIAALAGLSLGEAIDRDEAS